MVKPGPKTTEFYIALIAQVTALLVLLGYIGPEEADMINGWVVEVVKVGGALLVLVVTAWQYIKSRTVVKTNG